MDQLNEQIKRIESKLDQHGKLLLEIATTQVVHTEQLKEHMRRTAIAEDNIEMIRDEIDFEVQSRNKKLEPLKKHVDAVNLLTKIVIGAFVAIPTLIGLYEFLTKVL